MVNIKPCRRDGRRHAAGMGMGEDCESKGHFLSVVGTCVHCGDEGMARMYRTWVGQPGMQEEK
jgi:hypothetical protein